MEAASATRSYELETLDEMISKLESLLRHLKEKRRTIVGRGDPSIGLSQHPTAQELPSSILGLDSDANSVLKSLKSIVEEANALIEVCSSVPNTDVPRKNGDSGNPEGPHMSERSVQVEGCADPEQGSAYPRCQSAAPDVINNALEGEILVLQPSAEQWRNFPAVLAAARRLGADNTGAFKVVLPSGPREALGDEDALQRDPTPQIRSCKGYRVEALPNGTYRVEMSPARQTFRHSLPCLLPPLRAVQDHEAMLRDKDGLNGVYYRTDTPAETPQQRIAAGLPERSAIWPLAGNELSQTKYSIPGLHWPYAYESGSKFGALFAHHHEDYGLYSINHLHTGRKLWIIIPPSSADAFVAKLKETHDISWDCDQCVRHASVFVPMSVLSDWHIPFRILDQKAPELVITMPRTYHSGFSTGYTLAEAVNYADGEWSPHAHAPCTSSCPDHPIPEDLLSFLQPGEAQRRVEDIEKRRGSRTKRTEGCHHNNGGVEQPEMIKHISRQDNSKTSQIDTRNAGRRIPAHMPILSADPAQRIPQIIDHILSHDFPPQWLGCARRDKSFRERLEQFLPGRCFDGLTLVKLLRIICRGTGLLVQDPPSSADLREGYAMLNNESLGSNGGLVLPLPLDRSPHDSGFRVETGYWALIVVELDGAKFISIGMDDGLAARWKAKVESELGNHLESNILQLRGSVEDFCSATLCCFALERHLGKLSLEHDRVPDIVSLRARYLTKLLETWVSELQLNVFSDNGAAEQPDPSATELPVLQHDLTDAPLSHCDSNVHRCFPLDLEKFPDNDRQQLGLALQDTDLSLEARARLLQLVMQCALPSMSPTTDSSNERNTIEGLVTRLRSIRQKSRKCTFEERITLVLLARKYQSLVADARSHMERERKIRRREFKSKEGPMTPKKRTLPTTAALGKLVKQQTLMGAEELKATVREGLSLLAIASELGYHSLAMFPGTVVRPHEFVLDFLTARASCFKSLSRPIDPMEYNSLNDKKLEWNYFKKWWQILRPDLQRVSTVDARGIAWLMTSAPNEASEDEIRQWQSQLRYAEEAAPSKRQRLGWDLRRGPG